MKINDQRFAMLTRPAVCMCAIHVCIPLTLFPKVMSSGGIISCDGLSSRSIEILYKNQYCKHTHARTHARTHTHTQMADTRYGLVWIDFIYWYFIVFYEMKCHIFRARHQPIMLIFSPIMLYCSAQNFDLLCSILCPCMLKI